MRTFIGLSILLLIITGCGASRTRNPVPKAQIRTVSLEGFDHARYWGDEASEGLLETFVTSWEQERVAMGLAANHSEFPDSHYLAISGGGQNGAFGAGVLCGWSESGKRPVFKVVTGISTGALTAPFAFLGSAYDKPMREVYTSVDEKDVAIFQGYLSLLRSDSAYDTKPLVKLAEKYFNAEMLDQIGVEHRKGRRLLIGTTHLDAGRPVVWDIGKIACSDRNDRVELFRKVLLASSAIPAAFPPIYLQVKGADGKMYDEMHVDGGVTREMFLLPSELRLFEIRDQHGVKRQSHLHVIRNAHYGPDHKEVSPQVASIAARSIDALIKSQAGGDLWSLYYEARENQMSYSVTSIPDNFVDDSQSMFDQKYMTRLFDQGFKAGATGAAWRSKPSFSAPPPTTRQAEATKVSMPAPQVQAR